LDYLVNPNFTRNKAGKITAEKQFYMDKETLFRDVRQGEVLLWVGAGFSRYAGYPMGQKTVEVLHESLSASEQQQLDPALALPRYAEELVDLHNGRRYHLTRVLQRLFTADPTSTKYHELLAQIPFIDKIVTTNYDTLFERVYGGRLHKITRGRDIGLGEPQQVEFYKVHGDIQNPDSLIVTEEDYRGFFEKQDGLLWKRLETLMAKYTVLFLGYSLEDQNVLGLFEKLLDQLGPMHRGAYLVAPGFRQTTINRLARRQVMYLDMTGETFVEELLASINDNILFDVKKGNASADKTSQFLRGMGLTFRYEDNPHQGGHAITSLSRRDGPTKYAVGFSVRPGAPVIKHLRKLETGKTSAPAYVEAADLQDYRLVVEGIRVPMVDIQTLIVARAPGFNKVVDVFFNAGPRFYGVEVRGYGRSKGTQIVAYTAHAQIKVNLKTKNNRNVVSDGYSGSVTVTPRSGVYASVQAGMEVCSLMRAIGQGTGFRLFEAGSLWWEAPAHPVNGFTGSADHLQQIMNDLQLVEDSFGIVFHQFIHTEQDTSDLYNLARILRKTAKSCDSKTAILLTLTGQLEGDIKELVESDEGQFNVFIEELQTQEFALLGWRFRVEVSRTHLIEQAILKLTKPKKTYRLTSKSDNVLTMIKEVNNKQILQRGQPQPMKTPEEELVEELTTDEMS
jgi:hypothetical protein